MLFRWLRKRTDHSSWRFDGYQIIKLVHQGHKAEVYQARYQQEEKIYALKLYSKKFDHDSRKMRRKYHLWTEGRVGKALNPTPADSQDDYPIVRTIDDGREYDRSSGAYYVVQDFIVGNNLKSIVTVAPAKLEGLRFYIANQIARALEIIHRRGFVYNDLCSDNVLLTNDNKVKLIDLGFVVPKGRRLHEKPGTPSYMSPEQIRAEKLMPSSDVYAFGVVMYELTTGRLPFGGAGRNADIDPRARGMVMSQHLSTTPRPPGQTGKDVPKPIEELIMKCLEKDPQKRPQDGRALMIALHRLKDEVSDY